jgi:hypothetical protein
LVLGGGFLSRESPKAREKRAKAESKHVGERTKARKRLEGEVFRGIFSPSFESLLPSEN